jgi:putative oxidoreductase
LSGSLEVLNSYEAILLVILRLVDGEALVAHGYPKVKGGRVQAGQWMKSMGIPPWTADLATILEFLGGIFLIFGLFTPLVGLFLVLEFGSIILVKRSKMHAKFISAEQGKPTYELDLFYLLVGLVFLFLGAGPYSLDSLVGL